MQRKIEMKSRTLQIILKFPYNARSDYLKQRALSENRARVDDDKMALKVLLRNFDKFANKIKHSLWLKQNVNELIVISKYGSWRTLLTTEVQKKLYENN